MTTKILIVDDSKLARMSVAKLLAGLRPSWTRLEATNADEAILITGQERPDIVLLDFNMPGRSGLELAAQLRDTYPHVPVAIISANIQIEIVDRTAQAGATFLPKPLTESVLGGFLDHAETRLPAR
jgi:CheY-like chemotaxis protein